MKNAVLIASLLLSTLCFAGGADSGDEKVITSLRVVDSTTGHPIIGADVHIGNEVYYTDPDGFVEIGHSASAATEISVSYVSYKDKTITLKGNAGLVKIALTTH